MPVVPGPWGWEFLKNGLGAIQEYPIALSGEGPLSDVLVASEDAEGHIIIRVEPEHRALIQAAPELLHACEKALVFIADGTCESNPYRLMCEVRAAIIKATGAT